jgi:hypothetical protein
LVDSQEREYASFVKVLLTQTNKSTQNISNGMRDVCQVSVNRPAEENHKSRCAGFVVDQRDFVLKYQTSDRVNLLKAEFAFCLLCPPYTMIAIQATGNKL